MLASASALLNMQENLFKKKKENQWLREKKSHDEKQTKKEKKREKFERKEKRQI